MTEISGADKKLASQHRQVEKLEKQLEQLKEVDMNLNQRKKALP